MLRIFEKLGRLFKLLLAHFSKEQSGLMSEAVQHLNFVVCFKLSFLLQALRQNLHNQISVGSSLPEFNEILLNNELLAFSLT